MLAIVNGRVLPISSPPLDPGTVLIADGRIVAVGEHLDIPAEAEIIDATGQWVTPGLIDAHCHVSVFGEPSGPEYWDGNEISDPVTPHLRALDAIHPEDMAFSEIRAAGVTTVLTGPGSANVIGGQWVCVKTAPRRTAEEMVLLEPAGMKMALGENPKRVYGLNQKKSPGTRMANAAVLRQALVQAQNYRRQWEHYERHAEKDPSLKPPDRDLRWEALVTVLQRKQKARIHCHRADDILTAVRIAEEFNLDLTIEHGTEGYKIADILAAKNIPVVAGPLFWSREKPEALGLNPKNPGLLARAGVKVAIQTDEMSAVKYLTLNAALAVREGMSEEDALRAITLNAAEIIGVADRVGSLEPGKDADVVLFSGHPFDYRTVVNLVLIDGQVVYRRE